jgi:hypothetical protein
MSRFEDNLQIACVKWFHYQYPKHIITSFPAGFVFAGSSDKRAITGKRMKDMGYLSGTPDLFIPTSKENYHGLFVELKVGKNKPNANQIEVMQKLKDNGFRCEVCYTIEGFIETVKDYLK